MSVASGTSDVLLFAASTSDKAGVSALSVDQFAGIDGMRDFAPLLAYHPDKVPSEAIYRFQDKVQNDDAVVAVEPGNFRELLGALDRMGVELVDA